MPNADVSDAPPARIALVVEYDGSAFSGWQKQSSPDLPTVQGRLEAALSRVADHPVHTICAGRTDAGVHATCQVCHFDARLDRGCKAWIQGVNSQLPRSVRVLEAVAVGENFHARFSATARRYHYVLECRESVSAILAGRVSPCRFELDLAAMQEAAGHLLGEQDFSAFRAAGCQSRSPSRNVHHARLSRQGRFVVFDIQANAFLQHMVRNLMGSLLTIGRGQQPSAWMAELLAGRDRRLASATADPDGLYLVAVDYPDADGLGAGLRLPPFLHDRAD